MPSSSALTSNMMSDKRKKRGHHHGDMTFISEQQNNYTDDSKTFTAYNRLAAERDLAKEQEKNAMKRAREAMM